MTTAQKVQSIADRELSFFDREYLGMLSRAAISDDATQAKAAVDKIDAWYDEGSNS